MGVISQTKATLRISGVDLEPEEITSSLGGSPTFSRKKGDIIRGRNGHERISKFGQWHLSASDLAPGDLNFQINQILEQLSTNIDNWIYIAEKYDVDMFCGLFMEEGMEGIEINPDILFKLGQREILLDLDIYAPDDPE